MVGFIIAIIVGIACIVIGIANMKGNISSIHSYHRSRVKEEDILPFGRLVGLGTVVIGCAIIVFGALSIASVLTDNNIFAAVGSVIMAIGIVTGMAFSFYAMIKYNKGIF